MPRRKEGADQQSNKNAPLQWINLTQPDEAKGQQYQRKVRAHVTRLQHRQTRDRNRRDALLKASSSGTSTPVDKTPESSRETSTSAIVHPGSEVSAVASSAPDFSTPNTAHITSKDEDEDDKQIIVRSSATSSAAALIVSESDAWRHPDSDLAVSFSRGEAAYRTFALDDADNIVGRTVNGLELDFSSIMSLYRSLALTQSKDFARQFGMQPKANASSTRTYEMAHGDPVTLQVVILIGVRNALETLGRNQLAGKDLMLMIEFERHLICSINNALQDSSRGLSDQILMAVALCAAYECKHGDNQRYGIHMTGLVRMINLRGGFAELGRHDMFVTRFLVWIDLNLSKIAGREPYLQDMYAGLETTTPHANLEVFRRPRLEAAAK